MLDLCEPVKNLFNVIVHKTDLLISVLQVVTCFFFPQYEINFLKTTFTFSVYKGEKICNIVLFRQHFFRMNILFKILTIKTAE